MKAFLVAISIAVAATVCSLHVDSARHAPSVRHKSVRMMDSGYQANLTDCYDLNKYFNIPGISLQVLCLEFRMNSCQLNLKLNVTYGGNQIINVDIPDKSQWAQCASTRPCQTCLEFDEITITPTGSRLCPKIVEKCPFVKPVEDAFNCIEVGSLCNSKSCRECLADSNCGWCEGQQSCAAKGVQANEPYCGSCSSLWTTDGNQCPGSFNNSGVLSNAAVLSMSIVIPVVVIALLVSGAMFYRHKKKKNEVDFEQLQNTTDSEDPSALEEPLNTNDDDNGDGDGYNPPDTAARPVNSTAVEVSIN